MSGGSFNYVSTWAGDLGELISRSGDLRDMADALEASFPDSAAARDTRKVADLVTKLACGDHPGSKALGDVWHEMEWWHSGDRGRDSAQKAVDDYAMCDADRQRLISWYQHQPDGGAR